MKKMRILCVSVLALGLAFIATSCKKDKETTSIAVSTCALEEEDENARVYLDFSDRNRMKWNGNDRIMVYNLDPEDGDAAIIQEYHTDASAEGEVTAIFNGPDIGVPQSDLGYYFFYPAQMVDQSYFDEDNRAKFVIGDTQNYTEIRSKKTQARITTIEPGTMAQAAQSEDLNFTMSNIFGVARIYMTGNKTVVKVELEDRALALTGSAKARVSGINAAQLRDLITDFKAGNIDYADCYRYAVQNLLYAPTPTGSMITMNCAHTFEGVQYEGVTLTNPDAKSFLFALRPAALCNGFILRVYFSDHTGSIIEVRGEDLANPRKYTIVPNRVQGIYFKDADGFNIPVDGTDADGTPLFPQFNW